MDIDIKTFIEKDYKELKRNKIIINNIDKDFFFKLVDELLKENENLKQALEINKRLYEDKCNDSIPKQKIKDKIEELNKLRIPLPTEHMRQAQINVLQELLENKEGE